MSVNFYEPGGKNVAALAATARAGMIIQLGKHLEGGELVTGEDSALLIERCDTTIAEALVSFGLRQDLPPAEAFAREAQGHGVPFDAAAWKTDALYRAAWEVFRAVIVALAEIDLGLDPKPEPAPKRAQPRPAPGDFAHEREARERIDPPGRAPAPGGGTPLSAVKGIGDKLEARLMAIGVLTVEQFVSERATDQFAERLKRDESLGVLLVRNKIFEKASAHLSE